MKKDKNLQHFRIQVWFEDVSKSVLLGTIGVYAETEEEAINLAYSHTEYKVSGVDDVTWQVREPMGAYIIK